MNNYNIVGKGIPRVDGPAKAPAKPYILSM